MRVGKRKWHEYAFFGVHGWGCTGKNIHKKGEIFKR